MSDIMFVALANAAIKIAGFVCITWAAVAFNNYGLLWWYIILIFIGIEYKHRED